ncbi:MAG: helix-turn-helix domain-containing protein [Bacteroidota bacterium]
MSEKDKQVIGKNLKFLRKRKGMTRQELADKLGIRRSSIGAYEECRATPKYETLENISDFFEVSIDLLVKEDVSRLEPDDLIGHQEQRRIDIEGRRLRVLPITLDAEGRENIEFVNSQKAAAGYLNGYSDPEYIEELPRFQLPMLGQGTYRAFEIKGDSMLPMRSGTIVIGEYMQDWRNGIKDGETYIIVSREEGVVYKRVFNRISGEGGVLLMRSDNPAYSDYEVDVDSIREVWRSRMYLSSDFPDPDISIERLTAIVMDLQREVLRLKGDRNLN